MNRGTRNTRRSWRSRCLGTTKQAQALACIRETREPETTLRNLRLISTARAKRGEAVPWAQEIEKALGGKP